MMRIFRALDSPRARKRWGHWKGLRIPIAWLCWFVLRRWP